MVKGNCFSCTFVIFVVNSAAHSLGFRYYLPTAGVTLRSPPACGLISPSGLLLNVIRAAIISTEK
jgi:hypothetical protein